MEEGGVVPSNAPGVSEFTGPLPQTDSGVSSLITELNTVESASPSPEIQWDTVNLDGFDFSPYEYPDWVNDLPSNDTIDEWFEQNAGPEVIAPETQRVPSLINPGQSVTINPTQEQVDNYNGYVQRRNEAAQLLENQIGELEGLQELERQHNDANRLTAERLFRELKPEALERFLETGDGSSLTNADLRDERLAYNLEFGRTTRSMMTIQDLLRGNTAEGFNSMIDEYIAENKDGLDENRLALVQERVENASGAARGTSVDVDQIQSSATEEFDRVRRENAARNLLSELAAELMDEDVRNDPVKKTQFEAQVYDDLMSDYATKEIREALGMGDLFHLISLDDNKDFVGTYVSESEDRYNSLVNIGGLQAEKAWAARYMDFGNFIQNLTVGLTGAGGGSAAIGEGSSLVTNIREDEGRKARYQEYLKVRKEIDEKIAKARESSNIYSHTREQVRTLGSMSGYTADDLAVMSADQIMDAREASEDIQTALLGMVDSDEFRMGLESLPDSLSVMAATVPIGAFGGVIGGIAAFGGSYSLMYSSTYWDKYAELDTNPYYSGLTREQKHGVAMMHGNAEGLGEAFGNLLFSKMGTVVGASRGVLSSRIFGDTVLKKAMRMFGGVLAGSQLGGLEEYAAESFTGYLQLLGDEYAELMAQGKVSNMSEFHQRMMEDGGYIKFYNDNRELIAEQGRIGYGMGLMIGGGSSIAAYARNEYQRVKNPDDYLIAQAMDFLGDETSLDALTKEELDEFNKKIEEFGNLSFTEKSGEKGRAIRKSMEPYLDKLGGAGYSTRSKLAALAEKNPAAVYDAYVVAQQIKNAERLTGEYTQDKFGRWKLNGRYIGDPTKTTLYQMNQKLSDEKKAELREATRENKRLLAEHIRTGAYAKGLVPDKASYLGRYLAAKTQVPRADGSFVIDKDTDLKGLDLSRRERRMYAAVQRKLRDGETIVVQPNDSALGKNSEGRYVEYENGTKEIHVVAGKAQSMFALLHENGHFFMEDALQNPETRLRVFNQTIKALEEHGQFELFYRVLSVTQGMSERAEELRLAGGITGAISIYESMSPETKANFERELITYYLDQIARGNITDFNGYNTSPVLMEMLSDFVDSRIGGNPVSLESIARTYMADVRRANGGLLGLKKAQAELRAAEENEAIVEAEAKAAEAGLSSTKLPSFAGGKVVMQFNRNAYEGEVDVKYKTITRNFNSFGHLVGYWRKMTANGMRPVIGQMAYETKGQYVHIKPTAGWIKKMRLATQ